MTVSIIIPVYNVSDYIEDCMRSVMNQTYNNIECILVDDASTDDSIAKCERMIAAYQGPIEFTVIHHETSQGPSAARNTGTSHATGEYVFYVDSDDELSDDCIEKLIKPMMNDGTIEMVMGNHVRCPKGCELTASDRITLTLSDEDFPSREAIRNRYFSEGLYHSIWNKLIKKEFLDQHHLRFKEGITWEDTLWFFFVVKYLNHLYTIHDVTYHYSKRPSSITTGMIWWEELRNYWCIVYEEIVDHLTEGEEKREAKYHWKRFCYRCINIQDNGKFRRIARKYKKALWKAHCYPDWCLLSMIVFLSRFKWGKNAFLRIAYRKKTENLS